MILDNEAQRTILLGVLSDFPVSGNLEQIRQAVINLTGLIEAVRAATITALKEAENDRNV